MLELWWFKPVMFGGVLGVLIVLEHVWPMFDQKGKHYRHDASNLALGILNAVLVAACFSAVLVGLIEWAEDAEFGLLRWLNIGGWWTVVASLLLLDLWMYAWHVMNHKWRFLWRFHAVHHADRDMDASSAVRFHTVEIVLSTLARMLVVPLLGVPLEGLLLYEVALQPVILLHHSNVALWGWLDRVLRLVLPTPRVHWVHHSQIQKETDSNYGAMFSFWDRTFGTFRLRKDVKKIEFGLEEWGERESVNLTDQLAMPFREKETENMNPELKNHSDE